MTTTQHNYSFHYITAAYAFSYLPHSYSFLKMMTTSNSKFTNLTPRTNLDTMKTTLSTSEYSKLIRAHGCHLNALEGFPLFAAAMIAGNIAKLPQREMNILGGEYLGVRLLYNVLYMTARNEAVSYLRSGMYAWSVGIPFYLLVKAGSAMDI